jgi:hypothetical protein
LNGESLGFIPDTSNAISDTIGDRQGDMAGNDVAAVILSTNNVNNKIVKVIMIIILVT